MAEANRNQPADSALVFRMGLHVGDLRNAGRKRRSAECRAGADEAQGRTDRRSRQTAKPTPDSKPRINANSSITDPLGLVGVRFGIASLTLPSATMMSSPRPSALPAALSAASA